MKNYMVYANATLVDNITVPDNYTISDYINECKMNGFEFSPLIDENDNVEFVETRIGEEVRK